jgi:hypothetical protein
MEFCFLDGFIYIGNVELYTYEIRTQSNQKIRFHVDYPWEKSIAERGIESIEKIKQADVIKYCYNCIYYVGQSYNSNYFHCSPHPYKRPENCPDFKQK